MPGEPVSPTALRVLPVGARAVLVEVADLAAVRALEAEIARRRAQGWAPELLDVVPGARTVLLDGVGDGSGLASELRAWSVPTVTTEPGPVVEIPCVYDGPDLEEVAGRWGTTRSEAIRRHTSILHEVAFCGFGPGFAYLAGLGDALAVPRRIVPRPAVPAGAVALGGPYTGIYPRRSPGGWQLIGRTEVVVWDIDRQPPALLRPGDRVRFVDATP